MENSAQQIEDHIEQTREALGSNLEELEQKVKSITDWKQHFRARPGVMMGLAFASGVMLAVLSGGSNRRRRSHPYAGLSNGSALPPPRAEGGVILDTWDNFKGALIGVATARLVDYARDVLSGVSKTKENRKETYFI